MARYSDSSGFCEAGYLSKYCGEMKNIIWCVHFRAVLTCMNLCNNLNVNVHNVLYIVHCIYYIYVPYNKHSYK